VWAEFGVYMTAKSAHTVVREPSGRRGAKTSAPLHLPQTPLQEGPLLAAAPARGAAAALVLTAEREQRKHGQHP
jgi:hypothetical protein